MGRLVTAGGGWTLSPIIWPPLDRTKARRPYAAGVMAKPLPVAMPSMVPPSSGENRNSP